MKSIVLVVGGIVLAVIILVAIGTFFVGKAIGQPPRAGIDEMNRRQAIEESEEPPTAVIKRSPRSVYTNDFKSVHGCVRSAAQP